MCIAAKKPLVIFILLFIFVPSLFAQWIEEPGGSPPARLRHTMLDINNTFYVFGGKNAEVAFDDVWKRENGTWLEETGSNTPPGRYAHTANEINGKMTVFFGKQIDGQLLSDIWEYDPDSKNWTQVSSNGNGPSARYGHASAYLPEQNKVYVFGGKTDQGITNDLYSFDLATNTWAQESSLTDNTFFEHRAVAKDGKMFVFGGMNQENEASNDIYKFTPGVGWEKVETESNSPGPRWNYAVASNNDVMHVIGGFSPSGIYDDHWVYDFAANTWDQVEDGFLLENGGAAAAFFNNDSGKGLQSVSRSGADNIILFGGWNFEGYLGSTWLYNGCVNIEENVDVMICEGENYNGYTEEGVYEDIYEAVNGCDSVVTLNLSVLPNVNQTIVMELCYGESYQGYSESGIFEDTFTADNGCDSIRILELTINNQITDTIMTSICFGESYEGYIEPGLYEDIFIAGNGCDSTRILHLDIEDKILDTIMRVVCPGDTYEGYSEEGVYEDVFTAGNGCDSTRVLELEIQPPIMLTDTIIVADDGSGNGSIKIIVDGEIVDFVIEWSNGSDSSTITDLEAGDYEVTLTDSIQCSTEFNITVPLVTSTKDELLEVDFTVSPNPIVDRMRFNLEHPQTVSDIQRIRMVDMKGRVIKTWESGSAELMSNELRMKENMRNGIYILQLLIGDKIYTKKVVVLR